MNSNYIFFDLGNGQAKNIIKVRRDVITAYTHRNNTFTIYLVCTEPLIVVAPNEQVANIWERLLDDALNLL